jgi:hypothetical protein
MRIFCMVLVSPTDPKPSATATGGLGHNYKLDSQISYLNQNLKELWPLAPVRSLAGIMAQKSDRV